MLLLPAIGFACGYQINNYALPGPLTPLGNQVLVKLGKVDDMTTGGLFVPTEKMEKPKEGVVVLCGPGKALTTNGAMQTCPVKVGDYVLIEDTTGEKVDYNGDQHIFCDADQLLGVFADQQQTVSAFEPIGDLILVEGAEQETETSTGIALAGLDDEEGNSGAVVAVGPGKRLDNGELAPPKVSIGESVMYVRRAGAEVTIEGKKFFAVSEDQCLCKW